MQKPQEITPKQEIVPMVGDVIYYLLSLDDLPRDPNKEWCGPVTAIHSIFRYAIVRVGTEGFEGLEEEVSYSQIVRVEKKDGSTSQRKARSVYVYPRSYQRT